MPFSLNPKQLRDAQSSLAVSFPDSYTSAMLQANGGEVEVEGAVWFLHPVRDVSDRKRASRTANHVELETMQARQWKGFPKRAVSVADDGCGNRLVLLPSESDPGLLDEVVYRWDHETCELDIVAPTFAGLK